MPIAQDIQSSGDNKSLTSAVNSVITGWTETDAGSNVSVTAAGSITITGDGTIWNNAVSLTSTVDLTGIDFIQFNFQQSNVDNGTFGISMNIAPSADTLFATTKGAYLRVADNLVQIASTAAGVTSKANITIAADTDYTIRLYHKTNSNFNMMATIEGGAYSSETYIGDIAARQTGESDETTAKIGFTCQTSGHVVTVSNVRTGSVTLSAPSAENLPAQQQFKSVMPQRLKSFVRV